MTPSPPEASSAPLATSSGLPFTDDSSGESSTPTFTIDLAGVDTVSYRLTAPPGQPDCSYDLQLVSDQGQTVPVLRGAAVRANAPRSAAQSVQLSAGRWRFLVATNGPACAWHLAVTAGAAPGA